MRSALLVAFFNQLPKHPTGKDSAKKRKRRQAALERFRGQVQERYTVGTLLRLLDSGDPSTRQAALLALGLSAGMEANEVVAERLHDEDPEIHQAAADALWSIWFRAAGEENHRELKRLATLQDARAAAAGLEQLIDRVPGFAEAYNQLAILAFRSRQFERSIHYCERTLQLNPCHFGAQAGIGQCYLYLRRHRAALKAFRHALELNPHLDGVAATVRALEKSLGEEGSRDDKGL